MKNPESPFPGPVTLSAKNGIFGRAREIAELSDRLLASRFVLLYSPSGAGKSSLLEAGLKLRLEKRGITTRPTMRVISPKQNGNEQTASRLNRYTASCLDSLKIPEDAAKCGLADYLPQPQNRELLVFDQFEEILTAGPADAEGERDRREFFRQLAELMTIPGRLMVFAMREDYLAPIDPFMDAVPQLLSSRMRINVLSQANAQKAIADAIDATGAVTIDDDAAKELAGDLAKGTGWVEPVQLQVVCQRMWQKLPEGTTRIGTEALKTADTGSSTEAALKGYYADVVTEVAKASGVAERTIRDWFEEKLISKSLVRMQAEVGPEDTAGLPNSAADLLEKAHLIRSDVRLNRRTRELTHDRLIRPIQENNAEWRKANLQPWQLEADYWNHAGRPQSRLMSGANLKAARRWEKQSKLLDFEEEFVRQSKAASEARMGRFLLWAIPCIAVVVGVFGLRAHARTLTFQVEELAQYAIQMVPWQPDGAVLLALEAERKNKEPWLDWLTQLVAWDERARARKLVDGVMLATTLQHDPRYLRTIQQAPNQPRANCLWFAPDGRLMAADYRKKGDASLFVVDLKTRKIDPLQGGVARPPDACGSGIDLPDNLTLDPPDDDDTFIELVDKSAPRRVRKSINLTMPAGDTLQVTVDSSGAWLAWSVKGGFEDSYEVYLQNLKRPFKRPLRLACGKPGVDSIRFSPDGRKLAAGCYDYSIHVWDIHSIQLDAPEAPDPQVLRAHTDDIPDLIFSPDGSRLYSSGADLRIVEWQIGAESLSDMKRKLGADDECDFAPGKFLACAAPDDDELVIEGAGGSPTKLPLGNDRFKEVAVAATGYAVLLTTKDDGKNTWLHALDLSSKTIGKGVQINGDIEAMDISRDGKWIATGSSEGEVSLWEVRRSDAPLLNRKWTPDDDVTGIALSEDGGVLAAGFADRRIRFWNHGKAVGQSILTRRLVKELEFVPKHPWLLSYDESEGIQFWDTDTYSAIGGTMPIPRQEGRRYMFGITADGSRFQILVNGDSLLGATSFNLDPAKFHDDACKLVPGGFDPQVLGVSPTNPKFRPDCGPVR